jgi:hypothetical protein
MSDFDPYANERIDLVEDKIPDDLEPTLEDHQSREAVEEALTRHCDGETDEINTQTESRTRTEILQEAFRLVFATFQDPNLKCKLHNQYRLSLAELVGRRCIALGWVVNPDLFVGTLFNGAPSLRSLAKEMGISTPAISELTSEVTEAFGISNRSQVHGDWRRKRRAAAKQIETAN